jgi:lysyl-tRNA synthetase class 1
MQWLSKIADEIERRNPDGDILIESGISPSGSYHMGYLREIITCDAIVLTLQKRNRKAKHIHFVDDQDGFRKVPRNLPAEYEKYLGKPLCDMPAPDGSDLSYADYALQPFLDSVNALGIKMEAIRSHEKYQAGYFIPAIELVLDRISEVRKVLEDVSGRKLGDEWSPIQVNEDGYLKKRAFVSIDTLSKTLRYIEKDGNEQTTSYDKGQVKLDWRLDWPARWWLMKVDVEPFGRDHATKGGSYDTGNALMDSVFNAQAPLPVPYEFINRAGESKKMSASAGNGIMMSEVIQVLPPEVIRFFVLRYSPDKTLYFDPEVGVAKLIDDYALLLAKKEMSSDEKDLIDLCEHGIEQTVSSVPFSHLVSSYQAASRDKQRTLEILGRTPEYVEASKNEADTILKQLDFIAGWLESGWAPEDIKFNIEESIEQVSVGLTEDERQYLSNLADEIAKAPEDADGEWFHKAIYALKESMSLQPPQVFKPLYKVLINKESGPRAGWFLSDLNRSPDRGNGWLVKRLRLEA